MKYKIEISHFGNIEAEFEADTVEEILEWYKREGWYYIEEDGNCCSYVYRDGKQLSFREMRKAGF